MLGSTASRLARAAAIIAVIAVLARVVGFGRVLVFARTVGSNCVGSTYQSANTVPNILFEIVAGGALASVIVPLLAPLVGSGDRDSLVRGASAFLTWTLLILTPLALLTALLARPITTALLGGSSCDEAVELGSRMLVIFAPQIVLYGVGIVLAGILQAHERFAGPAVAPLVSSLVVIVVYLIYWAQPGAATSIDDLSRPAELTLSVGTTLGVVALSLCLLVPLRRAGLHLRPTLRFPAGMTRHASRLAGAGAAVLAAQQFSVAVAVRLANDDVPGSTYVVYWLAFSVFLVPWAVLAVPIATSAFPRLSTLATNGEDRDYQRTAAGAIRAVIVVTTVAAGALIAAAPQVSRVIVQGVGESGDVTALTEGIVGFAPGLIGYGLLALVSRALYARGDARTPAVCQVAGWCIVLLADVIFSVWLPHDDRVLALALGNTVGMTAAAVLLLITLTRAAGAEAVSNAGRTLTVALAAALLAGLVGRLVGLVWDGGGAIAAVWQSLGIGIAVFVVASSVLIIVDRDDVRGLIRRERSGAQ